MLNYNRPKKLRQNRLIKFISKKIKNLNLFFLVTYSEPGTPETYTDILHPSEIEINDCFERIVKNIRISQDPKSREIKTDIAKRIIRFMS